MVDETGAEIVFQNTFISIAGLISVTLLFLVLFSAVFYVRDTDLWKSKYIAKEVGYVATMVSDSSMEVQINYGDQKLDDLNIDEKGGIIEISYDKARTPVRTSYFGDNIKINKRDDDSGIFILSSTS